MYLEKPQSYDTALAHVANSEQVMSNMIIAISPDVLPGGKTLSHAAELTAEVVSSNLLFEWSTQPGMFFRGYSNQLTNFPNTVANS